MKYENITGYTRNVIPVQAGIQVGAVAFFQAVGMSRNCAREAFAAVAFYAKIHL